MIAENGELEIEEARRWGLDSGAKEMLVLHYRFRIGGSSCGIQGPLSVNELVSTGNRGLVMQCAPSSAT